MWLILVQSHLPLTEHHWETSLNVEPGSNCELYLPSVKPHLTLIKDKTKIVILSSPILKFFLNSSNTFQCSAKIECILEDVPDTMYGI